MKLDEVTNKFQFFHVSPSSNDNRIIRNGLVPNRGDRTVKLRDQSGVYLFPSMDAVEDALMNWLGDEFNNEQLTIWGVVSLPDKSKLSKTTGWEYIYNDIIPPRVLDIVGRE